MNTKGKSILKNICAVSLAACMLTGYALPSVGAATAPADAMVAAALGEYTPTEDLKTNRIYFALPGAWLNEETEKVGNTPGVYWFSGADQPDRVAEDGRGWPGYLTKKAEEEGVSNLFYTDIPEGNGSEDVDVTMLIWNNYLDGGTDRTRPIYLSATQTTDFSCQFYSKGDSDLYDDEYFAYIYMKTFESLGYDYDLDPTSDTFWEDINRAAAKEFGEDYDSTDPKYRNFFIYDLFDMEDDEGKIDLSGVFGAYGSNFFDERMCALGMSFTFDNMVYVVDLDPNHYSVNYEGKRTYIGDVFFYYGGGEYGQYPTKELNEEMNGVGGNFMDDAYLNSEQLEFKYEENSDGGITITDYYGYDTELVIPSEINGKPVTEIGWYAFGGCSELISVTIPDSVHVIAEGAFSHCTSLTSIIIPESVEYIDNYAFYYCYSLEHVLYSDSTKKWESIEISDVENSALINANVHFNSQVVGKNAPDCTNMGYYLCLCSECEDLVRAGYAKALGHNFVNNICERCGADKSDCMESDHPYSDNTDESWTIHKEGAKRIAITFSEETETEWGCDYIYLYDMYNEEVGCYTGNELAGKRIVVQGDTVTIRLTADDSNTDYGFSLTDIQPYYEDCTHPETELVNAYEAGCGWDGYTGDIRCVECQEIFVYGEYIDATGEHLWNLETFPPTCGQMGYTYYYCENCGFDYEDDYVDPVGEHEFEDGICTKCGNPDLDLVETIPDNFSQNIEISVEGQWKYYKYTPSVDGILHFYSSGGNDPIGCVYDSDMLWLLAYNDDGDEGYNFDIWYDVTAGETYVLACGLYDSEDLGSFNITVSLEPTEPDENLLGDVNGDGKVNVRDRMELTRNLANWAGYEEINMINADVNCDDKVNVKDRMILTRHLANWDGYETLPVLG